MPNNTSFGFPIFFVLGVVCLSLTPPPVMAQDQLPDPIKKRVVDLPPVLDESSDEPAIRETFSEVLDKASHDERRLAASKFLAANLVSDNASGIVADLRKENNETFRDEKAGVEKRNGFSAPAEVHQNWPQFRGVGAAGVSSGNPPVEWNMDTGTNVLWKTEIEGLGHSGPIVWDDNVFLTTAVNQENDKPSLATGWSGGTGESAADKGEWHWKLICIDRKDGKIKWSKTAKTGTPTIERHIKATHANCTAATNGKQVVAFFGSEGLYCYDFDGNLQWKKDLGKLHSGPYDSSDLEWGFASSPVIYKNMVILQCDCLNTNFVSIIDIGNGEEIRRIERDDVATWSSPCVFEWKGKTQIVCNGYKQMASYDLETGKQLWSLKDGGDVPVPTPLFDGALVHLTNGHGRTPAYAISPDATGDITPTEDSDLPEGLVWYRKRGGSYMPTPIIVGDLLYNCNDNGVLTVRERATGKDVYKKRVASGGKNNFSASAIATQKHLYFSAESGHIVVVKTGRTFERVATNEMNGIVMATPAISGNQLFIRTLNQLVCISPNDK